MSSGQKNAAARDGDDGSLDSMMKTISHKSVSDASQACEITIFEKTNGLLTKKLSLVDDRFFSDGAPCRMSRGLARRRAVPDTNTLAAVINSLQNNEAIGLGRLRADLPHRVKIRTKSGLSDDTDAIARTAENIVFVDNAPAFALIDFDAKGLTDAVRENIAAAGGVWGGVVSGSTSRC